MLKERTFLVSARLISQSSSAQQPTSNSSNFSASTGNTPPATSTIIRNSTTTTTTGSSTTSTASTQLVMQPNTNQESTPNSSSDSPTQSLTPLSLPKPYTIMHYEQNKVHELLFPQILSQAGLSGSLGSNAWTVISVLTRLYFLLKDIVLPCSTPDDTIRSYCRIMQEGNTLYSIITRPVNSPNLMVEEVLKAISVPIKIPDNIPSIVSQDYYNNLSDNIHLQAITMTLEMCIDRVCQGEYSAFVLIVAPDMSMTLCSDETNIYLSDSHLHQNHGALVAHCKKASKAEFRN